MTAHYYVLDNKGEAQSVGDDPLAWARWLEQNPTKKFIDRTSVGDADVSTVFLGINHQFIDEGPPLIFETMIFGGEHDQDCWRWSTRAQAIAGHDQVVAALRHDTERDSRPAPGGAERTLKCSPALDPAHESGR